MYGSRQYQLTLTLVTFYISSVLKHKNLFSFDFCKSRRLRYGYIRKGVHKNFASDTL